MFTPKLGKVREAQASSTAFVPKLGKARDLGTINKVEERPQEKKSNWVADTARAIAKTPLKALGTAETAIEGIGKLAMGDTKGAEEVSKKGGSLTRSIEGGLGYKEGDISKPFKIGTDVEEQLKGKAMFGKNTTDVLGAGAELASYGMGFGEAKAGYQATKAGAGLLQTGLKTGARETIPGAIGMMGSAGQEEDATKGSVLGAGLLGAGFGFAGGMATPFVSKSIQKVIPKSWTQHADEVVESALQSEEKKVPTHWTEQKPVEAKPISTPLSDIDDDLFPEVAPNAVPVNEKVKKKAIKSGFKEWQTNLISEMSPEERQAGLKMFDMAENKSRNIMASHPVQEAAKPILEQVKHLQSVKKTAGASLDGLVDSMPNEAIPLTQPTTAMNDWLDSRGIQMGFDEFGKPALDFSGSKFSTSASAKDRKVIQEVFDELMPARAKGEISYRTPKEIRTMRQRLMKVTDANKKAIEVFSDETNAMISGIRQELNTPLSELSPEYAKANKDYAIARSNLEDFFKFLGKDFVGAEDDDITRKLAEILPRLVSNTSAKPGVILRELADAAEATGLARTAVSDPRRLIYLSEMMNDLYGLHAPRGFQGSIERAGENVLNTMQDVAGIGTDLMTGRPLNAAGKAMTMFKPDEMLKRRQLLKQMLKEGAELPNMEAPMSVMDKGVNKTSQNMAMGGVAGTKIEKDEEGKLKVSYDPKMGALGMIGGVALPTILERAGGKLAPELIDTMEQFIDHVRLKAPKDALLEADGLKLAEDLGLKAKTKSAIANQFDDILKKNADATIGEPTEKGLKSVDPLISEARKYKSAEEFVKGQGTPIFRGDTTPLQLSEMDTSKVFNPSEKEALSAFNNTPGLYFTDSVENANSYGKNITKVSVDPKANIIDVKDAPKLLKRSDVEKIIKSNPDFKDWSTNWDENSNKALKMMVDSVMAEKNGNEFLKAIWSDGGFSPANFTDAMKKAGIDGIKVQKEGVKHFVLYNKDSLKSESQLTDIWNKAQGSTPLLKPAMKPIESVDSKLLQEAKKYKSAEEFVNNQPSYFHSTDAKNVPAIEQGGFKASVGERSLASKGDMTSGVFLYDEVGSADVFGQNFVRQGKKPATIETKVNGKIYDANTQTKYGWEDDLQTQEIASNPKIIEQLKKDGFVGVKSTELGTNATFVFEPSQIKTKSQLTDIWNKANKKPSNVSGKAK
jgi:hypothetical protein